ncbi:MAG TPA: hypothetical protein VH020_00910 [Stellaceae bacterium]|nr:hypothetical protein [Stellaceae bacterium]
MNRLTKILPIAALAVAAPLVIAGAAKAQVYVTPAAPYACGYANPYYCPGYAYYDYGWPGYVGYAWGGGWAGGGRGGWGHGAYVAHGSFHGAHGSFSGGSHHR